jgi:hypothetical protein
LGEIREEQAQNGNSTGVSYKGGEVSPVYSPPVMAGMRRWYLHLSRARITSRQLATDEELDEFEYLAVSGLVGGQDRRLGNVASPATLCRVCRRKKKTVGFSRQMGPTYR